MTSCKVARAFRSNLLLLLTLIGVILGVGLGFAARTFEPSDDALMWLGKTVSYVCSLSCSLYFVYNVDIGRHHLNWSV